MGNSMKRQFLIIQDSLYENKAEEKNLEQTEASTHDGGLVILFIVIMTITTLLLLLIFFWRCYSNWKIARQLEDNSWRQRRNSFRCSQRPQITVVTANQHSSDNQNLIRVLSKIAENYPRTKTEEIIVQGERMTIH